MSQTFQHMGEVNDLSIDIDLRYMRGFMSEFIRHGMMIQWVHASEIDLALYVWDQDDQYVLSFQRDKGRGKVYLKMEMVPLFSSRMKEVMEKLIHLFKGNGKVIVRDKERMYKSEYEKGKMMVYKEMDHQYNVLDYVTYRAKDEVMEYVRERMIDYRLMELSDLMKAKRYKGRADDVRAKKKEIADLVNRENVEVPF